jgi:hypothetical protein
MIGSCLRLLSMVTILLMSTYTIIVQAHVEDQEPGDEHWAGNLTISGFDSIVTSLVNDRQGNIYAGGDFASFGGEAVNHIAKWDGSTWSGLGHGLKEPVNNLVVDSRGNLYTDVLITPDSGLPETVVMRWDGSSWSALEGDLSSLVDTLEEGRDSNILINDLVVDSRDQLYAGGYFYLIRSDRYVGYVARWDGSNWTLLGSGMNHMVYDLAVDGQDNIYAGGEFTSAGGVPDNRIAKWEGGSWSALGSGLGGEASIIADMEADESGNLFVTGQFESAGGVPIQLIAMWDGASWKDLAPANNRGWFEGDLPVIYDLAVDQRGDLYAGGSFAAIDGVEANNIARWDDSSWNALGTMSGNGVNERVSAISVDENDQVFLGGFFTSAGGLPANHIARWDGSTWFSWTEGSEAGVNDIVDTLAIDHDGVLYVGGYFTSAGTVSANHIARWDGTQWSALAKGLNAAVHAIALDSTGSLYAGGEFTAAGDVALNYIARWDGVTWSALGDGMAAEDAFPQVRALAVDGQGNLYAGGDFTTAGGVAANYVARWDGSAWSALGRGTDDQVTALVVDPHENLYAAGWFKRAGDVEANGIARWDGSSWSALGSGTNMVGAIAIDQEGDLYAAGMFYIPPDSGTFHYIARWDGSTWNPLGNGVDNSVHAVAVDQRGNLYAVGDFTNAGETLARRIARWDGVDWSPLGSGIGGGEGDYSSPATLVVDDRGNLYVGGQFTLVGNKSSTNLAKWCAKLEAGGCTFSFEAKDSTPEPTPVLTAPVPLPSTSPTISVTEPGLIPIHTPTSDPRGVVTEAGMDERSWIGTGIILALLLGVLLFFLSRRS